MSKTAAPQQQLPPLPWQCDHHAEWSEIVAADGTCLIAALPHMGAYNGKFTAEMVVTAMNERYHLSQLVREMAIVLEMCLDSEKLSWEAEHDGQIVLAKARSIGV